MWIDSGSNGSVEVFDSNVKDTEEFSTVSDADHGVHVVWRGASDGNVTYAYRGASSSSWTLVRDIFHGNATFPTISADYSTNNVYALAIWNGNSKSSIIMKEKLASGAWSDSSAVFPVTNRVNPVELGSNYASASLANSTTLQLVWREGTSSPFNVTFASIPVNTVWSPYASPIDPWNGNGLAPYGQYFANLGEYVSPSTGLLTVRQTDLSVPGRGLNLELTRVYTEPNSFLTSPSVQPYNYETYPWAPTGNGWQLNFPWMNNVSSPSYPSYIHLWNGEGYRIPSSFWNSLPSTFENHQGENFRLTRNSTGVFLYDKSGIAYSFDPGHLNRLTTIIDPLGNNITFTYNASNLVSCITDTVGRAFLLSYSGQLLESISQINGSCTSPGSSIRSILYQNSGGSLTRVTDPLTRFTTYSYGTNPWLLTRVTYPTGWYDAYSWTAVTLGTQTTSYRVSLQQVNSTLTSSIRQFAYAYTQGPGDQVTNSTVKSYDGSQLVGYTHYAFSFAGMTENITDSGNVFVRGVQQRFGINGEVPREIILVSPTQGYTNYYRYDLWGNQIYSRRVINPSSNWYHESFNAYYNNGLPPDSTHSKKPSARGTLLARTIRGPHSMGPGW
jgi:YD repeat-containing protein